MQDCLGSIVNDSVLIYLEDISKDILLFQQLHHPDLKLQPGQCQLFQQEVTNLYML